MSALPLTHSLTPAVTAFPRTRSLGRQLVHRIGVIGIIRTPLIRSRVPHVISA